MTTPRFDQNPGMHALREAMYRLLEEGFVTPSDDQAGDTPIPLDLLETPEALVARAALPGVRPEDIDVTITGETLTVRGEVHDQPLRQGSRYHHREGRHGSFSRSITLPLAVQADAAQADYDLGVLTLTMPKLEQAAARTIKIANKPSARAALEVAPAPVTPPGPGE